MRQKSRQLPQSLHRLKTKGVNVVMSKGKWKHFKAEENQPKKHKVTFRVTDYEQSLLLEKSKKCNLNTSEYIIATAVYADLTYGFMCKQELQNLSVQILKLGTNINQIAKALNTILLQAAPNTLEIQPCLTIIQKQQEQTDQLENSVQTILENITKRK